MESARKMHLASSAVSLNGSSITSSQTSTRSNYRLRDNHVNHVRPFDETKERLEYLLKGINETSAENMALIKESSTFLKSLDLDPKSMSMETTDQLEKVSAIMRTQGLSSLDEGALALSLISTRRKDLQKSRDDRELKRKYEDLCNRYSKLEEKVNYVQERVSVITDFVDSAREANEKEYSEIVHKATKLNEYRETAKALEEELAGLRVADDSPERIAEKYSRYLGATGELAELNKIVSQYGDLPADILQAKAAVEQKEKRRLEVKNLLDKRMIS